MGEPKSLAANNHARVLLERAESSPKGISVTFTTRAAAEKLRFSCYTVRTRQQALMRKTLPHGDPMWGKTPWDNFSLTIVPSGEKWLLKIAVPTLDDLEVTEL